MILLPTDRDLVLSTKHHEGFRATPYRDTRGFLTVGYGTNLEAGITEEQAQELMMEEYRIILNRLERYDWYHRLSLPRKRVLAEMSYQLGSIHAFKRMRSALENDDFEEAAVEMLDSRWAVQTPERAKTLARRMREG